MQTAKMLNGLGIPYIREVKADTMELELEIQQRAKVINNQ